MANSHRRRAANSERWTLLLWPHSLQEIHGRIWQRHLVSVIRDDLGSVVFLLAMIILLLGVSPQHLQMTHKEIAYLILDMAYPIATAKEDLESLC